MTTRRRILNIDIGGGTTKLALTENGRVLWTAALHIGGRLIAAEDGRVARIDPAGRHHAKQAGLDLAVGDPVTDEQLARIARHMAGLLQSRADRPPDAARGRAAVPDRHPRGFRAHLGGSCFPAGSGSMSRAGKAAISAILDSDLGTALREMAEAGQLRRADAPGRRLHPRDRTGRLGIFGSAQRADQHDHGAGQDPAAPKHAGAETRYRPADTVPARTGSRPAS